MTSTDLAALNDDALLEYFRKAAIEKETLLYNTRENNRIDSEELVPCWNELAARGPESASKILRLTRDKSPEVRLNAAIFGFDLDPSLCRSVLIQLLRTPDFLAATALIMLLHKDPEVSAEFSRLAAMGVKDVFEPLVRRFGDGVPKSS